MHCTINKLVFYYARGILTVTLERAPTNIPRTQSKRPLPSRLPVPSKIKNVHINNS